MASLDRKRREVIGDALARAMADMPGFYMHSLNRSGFNHSGAMEIARRMVRELDHAGWQVKDLTREKVRDLEDQICMGLSMADCSRLASQSPEWAKQARDQVTLCVCN